MIANKITSLGSTTFVTALAVTATVSAAHGVNFTSETIAPSVSVEAGSAVQPSLSIDKSEVRYEIWPAASRHLVALSRLSEDHNGEGAAKPSGSSIHHAVAFVRQLPFYAPEPLTGVGSDGFAVVEFNDAGDFGQIVFYEDGTVDAVNVRQGLSPIGFEGVLTNEQFSQTFGFRLTA